MSRSPAAHGGMVARHQRQVRRPPPTKRMAQHLRWDYVGGVAAAARVFSRGTRETRISERGWGIMGGTHHRHRSRQAGPRSHTVHKNYCDRGLYLRGLRDEDAVAIVAIECPIPTREQVKLCQYARALTRTRHGDASRDVRAGAVRTRGHSHVAVAVNVAPVVAKHPRHARIARVCATKRVVRWRISIRVIQSDGGEAQLTHGRHLIVIQAVAAITQRRLAIVAATPKRDVELVPSLS